VNVAPQARVEGVSKCSVCHRSLVVLRGWSPEEWKREWTGERWKREWPLTEQMELGARNAFQ